MVQTLNMLKWLFIDLFNKCFNDFKMFYCFVYFLKNILSVYLFRKLKFNEIID